MKCDHCGGEFEELVSRSGYKFGYFVEWTCESCFKVLNNVSWEEYAEEHEYEEVQLEAGD